MRQDQDARALANRTRALRGSAADRLSAKRSAHHCECADKCRASAEGAEPGQEADKVLPATGIERSKWLVLTQVPVQAPTAPRSTARLPVGALIPAPSYGARAHAHRISTRACTQSTHAQTRICTHHSPAHSRTHGMHEDTHTVTHTGVNARSRSVCSWRAWQNLARTRNSSLAQAACRDSTILVRASHS